MSTPDAVAAERENRYRVKVLDGLTTFQIGAEAIITLQDATGYVAVSCPHYPELNGCHWWAHRGGNLSLRDFLLGLDRDYVIGKLFGRNETEEFDGEETIAELKRSVIEARRDSRDGRCGMSAEEARDLWEDIKSIHSVEDVEDLNCADAWELIRRRPKRCIDWFWDEVWASFIAHLRSQTVPT